MHLLERIGYFNMFTQNIDCGYTLELPHPVPTKYVLEQTKNSFAIYKWGMRRYILFMDMFP